MLPRTKMVPKPLLWLILLCALPLSASAQSVDEQTLAQLSYPRLVNLDTPSVPPAGRTSFRADVRAFGAQEDAVYGTLALAHGVSDTLALILRGSLAETKTFAGSGFDIRHGGTDLELVGRWRPTGQPYWGLEAGLSWANTPAQQDVFLTTQLLYQRPVGSHVVLHFVPRAVFVKDNPLVGIGGGVSARLSDTLEVVGDLTGIVSGNNTRSVYTGDKQRSEVWGLALRWRPRGPAEPVEGAADWSVDIGATNGLGGTTGFSLTPGLSGSTAFYISLTLRR